ncbi:MAG: CHAD domain-containing protein [Planctomycetes bacterium]|nr:CHAD domain-containing protein [Planctomycetota bacterium]
MPPGIETEFKLRATTSVETARIDAVVREAGCPCEASGAVRHQDVYLDDERRSLLEAGIGLRLRDDQRGRRLCSKRRAAGAGGLFVREELEAEWPGAYLPRTAQDLPSELRDAVEPFVLARPLVPWLQLDVDREVRQLAADGGARAELAIDFAVARAGAAEARFTEVEIEVFEDVATWERLAALLATRLPLQPAEDDKPGHALHLLGLALPPAAAPVPLAPEVPTGRAIAAIAAAELRALREAEVLVRSRDEAEPVHAMRVALRRLRAVARAFRALWPEPEARWLLETLAATARRLGPVRDLDVMRDELPEAIAALPAGLAATAEAAQTWLLAHCLAARTELREWLRCPERLQQEEQLRRLLAAAGPTGLATEPVGNAARSRLAAAAERVRQLGEQIPADLPTGPLHELRIACKRLRYLAEHFAALLGQRVPKAKGALARLQQALGRVCDHEVAAGRLLDWLPAIAAESQDGILLAAAVGGLATRHHRAAKKARRRAARQLAGFLDHKAWKAWKRRRSEESHDAKMAYGCQDGLIQPKE